MPTKKKAVKITNNSNCQRHSELQRPTGRETEGERERSRDHNMKNAFSKQNILVFGQNQKQTKQKKNPAALK